MNKLCLILLINLSYYLINAQKIIEHNIRYANLVGKVLFMVGKSKSYVFFELDLSSDYSMINIKNFDTSKSVYKTSRFISYGNYIFTADLYSDIIQFTKNTSAVLNEFYFFYKKESVLDRDEEGLLSLSFKQVDKNHSIVYQLKKQNLISEEKFGITSDINQEGTGKIYFGGFPPSIITNKYKTKIKIDDKKYEWSFPLDKIIIGKNEFMVNSTIYFQLNIREILVSKQFLTFLDENVFYSYYENKTCVISEKETIECECKNLRHFPTFNFTVGENVFQVNTHTLFADYSGKCIFLMKALEPYRRSWVLGATFFTPYQILFDYEDKSVVFYSQYKILLREDNLNIITYLYLSNIVLLASFSILHFTIWSKLIFLLK